jgi:hypothetical protein
MKTYRIAVIAGASDRIIPAGIESWCRAQGSFRAVTAFNGDDFYLRRGRMADRTLEQCVDSARSP